MEALTPGHQYELDNLGTTRKSNFQFHMDPEIHDGKFLDGPNCQEVLRMVIDRVKHLDGEKPWSGNADILRHLRSAIALFESRAVMMKIEKGELEIENLTVGEDGHIKYVYDGSSTTPEA